MGIALKIQTFLPSSDGLSLFSFASPQLAAKRLGKYWKKRVALFGPDRAFLPMYQSGAFRDNEADMDTMRQGFARLLPSKDPQGRAQNVSHVLYSGIEHGGATSTNF